MNGDRLAELHNVLEQPLRCKILPKLSEQDSLTFDDLTKNLKTDDPQELSSQLAVLESLTVEGEHLISKQSDSSYQLTEMGHYVLDEMIAFPELESDSYKEKLLGAANPSKQPNPQPKWFRPYWIAIFVSAIVVLGIIFPVFGHQSFGSAIFYLFAALLILGFGYYIRVNQPSMKTYRLIYIGLFAWFFGCCFSIAAIFFLSRIDNQIDAFTISVLVGCFVLGGFLGDLIGKARHYKGPAQYSP